jgi:uncharacterized peroxidase-related enzyme
VESHAAGAAALLGDEAVVRAVLADYRTAPISAAEKALLAFVEKVNKDARSVSQQDVEALHEAGWSDEAIFDAVTVCALFNFYNRWVDATGVQQMSPEGHRASGARIARRGYRITTQE